MKRLYSNIFNLIYGLTLPILFLDAYRSRASVHSYLNITSRFIEIWVIVALIIFRIFFQKTLSPVLAKLNIYVLFPITFLLGVSLTIWVYFTPPNYVYSLTYIQATQVVYIAAFSGIVWLLSHTDSWFKENYKRAIFFGSIAYLFLAYIVSLFPNDVFAKVSKEDHLIENTQVVVLLLGAYWAIKAARIFFTQHSKVNALIFILAALALVFVAGDEISWGQRIFHLVTPAGLASINDQKEMTIHNLNIFDRYVGTAYMIIGFYGTFAWLIQSIVKSLKKIPFIYYIPPWFCSIFFFTIFFYNFYTRTHPYHQIGVWSESTELMLYSGIMFTLLSIFLSTKKKQIS